MSHLTMNRVQNPLKHKEMCYLMYRDETTALEAVAAMNRYFVGGLFLLLSSLLLFFISFISFLSFFRPSLLSSSRFSSFLGEYLRVMRAITPPIDLLGIPAPSLATISTAVVSAAAKEQISVVSLSSMCVELSKTVKSVKYGSVC
jgi:hypothetical protein